MVSTISVAMLHSQKLVKVVKKTIEGRKWSKKRWCEEDATNCSRGMKESVVWFMRYAVNFVRLIHLTDEQMDLSQRCEEKCENCPAVIVLRRAADTTLIEIIDKYCDCNMA